MTDRDKAIKFLNALVKLDPKMITSKEHAQNMLCISQSYAQLTLVLLAREVHEYPDKEVPS